MPKLQKNIVWTLLHAFWIYRWTILISLLEVMLKIIEVLLEWSKNSSPLIVTFEAASKRRILLLLILTRVSLPSPLKVRSETFARWTSDSRLP